MSSAQEYTHTPTTEEVETHWADVGFGGDRASFRRWLAEVERAAADEAWKAGFRRGHITRSKGEAYETGEAFNPHKKEATSE